MLGSVLCPATRAGNKVDRGAALGEMTGFLGQLSLSVRHMEKKDKNLEKSSDPHYGNRTRLLKKMRTLPSGDGERGGLQNRDSVQMSRETLYT